MACPSKPPRSCSAYGTEARKTRKPQRVLEDLIIKNKIEKVMKAIPVPYEEFEVQLGSNSPCLDVSS